jgi:hypothetical protein
LPSNGAINLDLIIEPNLSSAFFRGFFIEFFFFQTHHLTYGY